MYFVQKTAVLIFQKKILHKLNSIPYWRHHVYKAEENKKHWYMIYLLWVVVWCAGRAVRFDLLWSFSEHHHHHHHSEKRKKAKVLFDYEPENEDELKIEVGDTVEIIKQVRKFPQSKSTGTLFRVQIGNDFKNLEIFWENYVILNAARCSRCTSKC